MAGRGDLLASVQGVIGLPVAGASPAARKLFDESRIHRPYNDIAAIVAGRDGEFHIVTMYWQLIQPWCRRFESKYTNFNTRVESLTKEHNVDLITRKRCLLPVTSFFETKKDAQGRSKKPREAFEFSLRDGRLMMLGGIYSVWRNPADENDRRASCSIITLPPNAIVGEVHPRMPFIVPPEKYCDWLDPGVRDFDYLVDLIQPFDSEKLERKKETVQR